MSFFVPVDRRLRQRHLQLRGPAGSSRAELRGMSGPGGEEHPQRKTPSHARVPGSHSWHEASEVSQTVTKLSVCVRVYFVVFLHVSVFLSRVSIVVDVRLSDANTLAQCDDNKTIQR